ncbi:MAG: DMT family transporter [Nocardioidaceae bacterium]
MAARRTILTGSVGIVLLVLAWGSTFAALKIGLDYAPPILFGGLRSIAGGLVMCLAAAARTAPPDLRTNWRPLAAIGWWNVVAFVVLQTLAIQALPSGLASVLIYLQPLLVAALAWWRLGESMHAAKALGLLLGFAGIVVVGSSAFAGHVDVLGTGYAVAAAAIWAIGTIVVKRVQDGIDLLWSVALPFLAGGVLLTLIGLVAEGWDVEWTGRFVLALAYSSLIGTAFAWTLWFGLVETGEASRASAYIFTVPVVAVIIGVLFLHESLHAGLVVGAVLVVLGIFLVNRRPAVV